ncbi:MAG: hypothetical protein ACP5OB_08435, partial [Candidatus Ratteibacteria bacterium]
LNDWQNYNILKFYVYIIAKIRVMDSDKDAICSIQLYSTDFDWKNWRDIKNIYTFDFQVPLGKPVEVDIPIDLIRFKNKVGGISFLARRNSGIYYIDKIELIKGKTDEIKIKEIPKEDIPESFSFSLKQTEGFWLLDTFCYNSEVPLFIEINSSQPLKEKKVKSVIIYYEKNNEFFKKDFVFEIGDIKKETSVKLSGDRELKIVFEDMERKIKVRDIKGKDKENLKIREDRKKTKNPFYRGIISLYAGTIYKKDGSVDTDAIISRVKELGANCYTYLIWYHPAEDFKALPEFLKKAQKENIEVWVYIVPPSEAPIGMDKPISERKYPPFDMDYLKWAEAISKLSVDYPNLTLWMIDDFDSNLSFFTLDYTKKIYEKTKEINPKLLFGVCVYYQSIKNFVSSGYLPYFDAVIWGYQAGLFPECGLLAKSLPVEINDYYKNCPDKILIPCIYFSPYSSWPKGRPTKEYLEEAIKIAYEQTGICFVYTMPRPGTMQEEVVKNFIKNYLK